MNQTNEAEQLKLIN